MRLTEIAERLKLNCLTPQIQENMDVEVHTAYISDVLSDIIVHAREGGLLLTIKDNIYALAVAVQAEFVAVVFSRGRAPEESVIEKAVSEGMPLFSSEDTTFDLAGKLYSLGLRGHHS